MFSLTDGTSRLDIDLLSWDGDAYVGVSVDSRGFSGQHDLHVLGMAFRSFCSSILMLHKELKGEARLTAVAPNELDVRIAPADALGHISVSGNIGYHALGSHTSFWHQVNFGFEIEPNQLDTAIKNSWVREYAA